MTITITGAAGFLGQRMMRLLAARGERLVLTDMHALPTPPPPSATVLTGPLERLLPQAITEDTTAVVHLAAVVSAGAEADFDLGYAVNLTTLQAVLERCREVRSQPKLLFTSSLAVFGAIDVATDASACLRPDRRGARGHRGLNQHPSSPRTRDSHSDKPRLRGSGETG